MREIFRIKNVDSPALHRQRKWVLTLVNFFHARWGERSFLATLAILIGVMAALAEVEGGRYDGYHSGRHPRAAVGSA